MKSEQDIIEEIAVLEGRYAEQHEQYRHLRNFWNGHMWNSEDEMVRSLVSVFRDMRHGGDSAEPDVKMTLPLIEAAVSKFMALLVNPPQISMDTPDKGYAGLRKEETCRALADQNEKFLYGLWNQGNVRRHFSHQSWYLPLFGTSFTGVHPDFKRKTVRFLTASPENAYPVWDAYREELLALGFKYEVPVDVAVRHWGPEVAKIAESQQQKKWGRRKNTIGPGISVIEWYDENEKQTLVAGYRVQSVEHKLGYCPWQATKFYDVPDEDFGKGVIIGNIPLFQKLNMLDSLELQAIMENVFARLVLIDPAMAPEQIESGMGAVIPLQKGGDAKWLTPPAVTTDLSASMARGMDFMQKGTHLPPAIYGEGVASSITTGKAQHEATLPTGNIVEYVQGNIGDTWQGINEKAIDMTETIFKNRKVVFFGKQFKQKGFMAAIERPEKFRIEIKGSDLKGWSKHELTFHPLLSLHEKIVMNLQLAGAGLVSKRYQRDAIGISDNNKMQEEVFSEQIMEIQVAAMLAQAQAGAMDWRDVEKGFVALEKGGTPSASGSPVAPSVPALPAGLGAPPAPPEMGPPPDLMTAVNPGDEPNLALPEMAAGAPDLFNSGSPEHHTQEGEFTLEGAVGDFSRIRKLKGEVWLIGEIVQAGATDGPIEVALTDNIDKATIINGLPEEYDGALRFHLMPDGPNEPSIEVGPGHTDPTAVEGTMDIETPDDLAASDAVPIPGGEFQDQAALSNFEPPLATNFPAGGFEGTIRSGGTF